MVSSLTILVGVALHGNFVFEIIVRGNIVWGLLDGNVVLDESIVFGIIVHVNIVCGSIDGNISASGIIVRFGIIVRGIIVRVKHYFMAIIPSQELLCAF